MKCQKPFLQGLTLLDILQRKTNNVFIITLKQVFPERGEESKTALGENVQTVMIHGTVFKSTENIRPKK